MKAAASRLEIINRRTTKLPFVLQAALTGVCHPKLSLMHYIRVAFRYLTPALRTIRSLNHALRFIATKLSKEKASQVWRVTASKQTYDSGNTTTVI